MIAHARGARYGARVREKLLRHRASKAPRSPTDMTRLPASFVQWLFSTTGSLSQRAARAGLWLAIGDASGHLVGVVKLVILARLLAPADFGLVALALLVTTWVHHFTEMGFSSALIHQRGDIRPYLNTAWTAQVLRSVGLAGVIVVTAPIAAWAFAEPSLVAILRVMAIETIIHGLKNPAVVYFRKELDTRREMVWRTSGVLAGFFVGVPAAFVFQNAWALVASLMAASVGGAVASYWVHPYRPAFQMDWPKLWELARFGRWVTCFRIVGLFTASLDGVVVGRVVGSIGLGFYQMAHQFTVAPISTIGMQLHGVLFPMFSKISDDAHRRRALVRILGIVASIVAPLGLFFTIFGGFVVRLALGAAWQGIEPLVEILVWVGVIRGVTFVIGAYLLAVGRPDLGFWASVPKLAVLAIGLYPATAMYGAIGAAYVVVLGSVASCVCDVALLVRVTSFSMRDVATLTRRAVLPSLPFAAAWLVLVTWPASVPLIAVAATVTSLIVVAGSLHAAFFQRAGA